MRGQRLSSASRRLDLVLVAARYTPDGRLALAQGYERLGQVWTDLMLFDRASLIERLRAGKHVAVGRAAAVPGDFEVQDAVVLAGANGRAVTRAARADSTKDDLRVPVF